MPSQTLSLAQARKLHLAAQGLLNTPRRKATRQDLRQCIERMQLLQIDTIHVVARSPYLVLFSRLGAYPPAWLDAALAEGHVFETWAHEACFAPSADVPLHRSYNRQARSHWGLKRAQDQVLSHRPQLDALLAHIDAHGPVKSSDFERQDGQGGGWWGWKDEKRWLETLDGRLRATHTTLLSPFDPLVWDRERASALWGFDYRIECYTPEEKRTYGYFVLPILHRGALVGRLDAKAHRTQGMFEVKALFLEPDVTPDEAALHAVARAIQRCADWHGTPEVCVKRTEPAALLSRLRGALRPGSSTR